MQVDQALVDPVARRRGKSVRSAAWIPHVNTPSVQSSSMGLKDAVGISPLW